jgi:hypothetical protein
MDAQAMSPHKQNVTFFARDVPNPAKSEAVGYPVFEAADYVRIETPGEKEGIPIFPATQEYKNRFPTEWENYRLKRAPTPSGMPLAILFPQYPERVAALEFANVRTVEQLAELSDTAKQNIGLGADEWQKKAIEFLKTAAKTHDYHALKKSQEMLEATIAKQEAQIVAMQMKLNEYEARMRTDPTMGVLGPAPFAAPPVTQPPSDLLAQMAAQIAALATKVEKAADPAPVKRRGRPPVRKPQPDTEETA